MRTILNIPDKLIEEAKIRAVQRGTSLTELLIRGLQNQMEENNRARKLPVSSAVGGLCPGVEWLSLSA